MPKVIHVKSARKDNPAHNIKKGDSYYHWSVMVGGRGRKKYSKNKPTRSQLTQSEFLSAIYDAEDELSRVCTTSSTTTPEEQKQALEDMVSAIDAAIDTVSEQGEQGDACDEKFNNLPDGFQQGDTGQLLESRREACERIRDELETAKGAIEDVLNDWDEQNKIPDADPDNALADVEDAINNVDWSTD